MRVKVKTQPTNERNGGDMYYNYRDEMREDIKLALSDFDCDSRDFDELYSELCIDDSVTGNGSGSYTFNTWKAKEYVLDNFDLLKDALEEFGCLELLGEKLANDEWEYCDVTIRCYLLGEILSEVLEDCDKGVDYE